MKPWMKFWKKWRKTINGMRKTEDGIRRGKKRKAHLAVNIRNIDECFCCSGFFLRFRNCLLFYCALLLRDAVLAP